MQRQIKFRVWDKSLNKYVYTNNGYYICESEMGGYKLVFNLNDNCWKGDYIIQQFTGLLDKNGKEIYEGDLLEINEEDKPNYFEDYCHVWYAEFSGSWTVSFNHFHSETCCDCSMVNRKYSVIGNIFENPDLLSKNE